MGAEKHQHCRQVASKNEAPRERVQVARLALGQKPWHARTCPHPRRTETPIPTADGASCGSQARRRAPLEQTNQSLSTLARTPPSRSQWRAYPILSPVHPFNVALRATGSGIEPAHAARAMQMTFAPSPSEVCAPAGQLRPTVATATSFQPSSAPSTW